MEKVCGVTKALPWALSFILALAVTEVSVAAPVTTSLPAVADTTLRQQQANQNRGGDAQVRLGWAQASRTLVRFDPAAIAAVVGDGTLISAHLELDVEETGESWPGGSQNVGAHRVTAAWTETGATWNCAIDAQPADNRADCNPLWNGGSFLASATATVPHTKETRGPVRFDVTADVAAFLAGAANEGWLLKKENEALSGRIDYVSREGVAAERAPRLVVVVEPSSGGDQTPPTVFVTSPADGAFVNTPQLQVNGTVTDDGIVAGVTINGVEATVVSDQFTAQVDLAEGTNDLLVRAVDSTGKEGFAAVTVVLDTQRPNLILDAPASGQLSNQASVRVSGLAEDSHGIQRVDVNGAPIPVSEGRFEGEVALTEGPNQLTIRALDRAGNAQEVTVEVRRFSLPEVAVTFPADLSTIAATTVEVRGTVTVGASVTVNGVSATVSGNTFVAVDVPLVEGGNIVTATATGVDGHMGTDTIHIVRDLTAPRVEINYPQDGARVTDTTVTVSGLINDIVPGTVNATEASVTVNGRPATVANRSFVVAGVPLAPGDNVLTAVATDESGNVAQTAITVRLETGVPRISVVSGDHQEGTIGTQLPEPLVVTLLDAASLPVTGRPVIFKVRGNDGSLDGGRRQIVVTSNVDGRAQAIFTLGTHAGVANQAVEASSVGFAGPAVFTASALPAAPALIVVDSGGLQIGVAGQQVPRPLIAAVIDAGYNRLEGVPVVFRVAKGSGHFVDGSQETVVVTDSDGRAIITFLLDPEEGRANNMVEARIQGLEGGSSASFVASGRAAGDPAGTTISGVVLDNTNAAIAGVTLRVKHTALTAVSDQEGQFRITGAPVGAVKLIVDGSTVSRPGSWPDLEFDLVTIAGRDNTVNMPIYLLPLDLGTSLLVDETRGGTLTLPQVPGFALEVAPGSVTFPGGSRSGLVSVTVVHNDKVPMVPNFGQQPRLIVTIQPAGARFDPPARLTLPNVEGLAPGKVTEMYSFDHDLGHFVSIGPATVSEDGTVIVSNPGVGIVKAGWHCGGDPAAGVCLHQCPECSICRDPPCLCDIPKTLCTSCSPAGSACDGEHGCKAGKDLIPKICDQLGIVTGNQQQLSCADVPEAVAAGADCGTGITIDYTRVTHNCDNIDLAGATLNEVVPIDHGCTTPDAQIQPGTCEVSPGNVLGPPGGLCRDRYFLCFPTANIPTPFQCTETLMQQIKIGSCVVETRTIRFTITKTATSCGGTTTRQ